MCSGSKGSPFEGIGLMMFDSFKRGEIAKEQPTRRAASAIRVPKEEAAAEVVEVDGAAVVVAPPLISRPTDSKWGGLFATISQENSPQEKNVLPPRISGVKVWQFHFQQFILKKDQKKDKDH